MKLDEVTSYVWRSSVEYKLGNKNYWDEKTFLRKWFEDYYPGSWERQGASGLYWFLLKDKTVQDLVAVKKPTDFPKKGSNISKISKENQFIFQENLCEPDEDGFLVIYNGHEKNVFARIRSHIALNNDATTAIGFGKYKTLSKFDLRVRVFHNKFPMDDLDEEDRQFIKRLLENKSGRTAIEQYWRTQNGWPVLCKE
ncbi:MULTISPECIES: hypothetical protein [Paenibacillus]|uniref:GIY-YIG domain-containing protein n=1 Tax=Paenibacillus urinalis TaxID=521520 RepID=A0AAX3N188_9BACL|nr:hypothetical protein [Paenibacillus urinalis]WDH83337.1 hypothetical protein PUW23_03575 [Paenibacillus urinalis]